MTMHSRDHQITKLLGLVALAVGLGVALLQLDPGAPRGVASASAADPASSAAAASAIAPAPAVGDAQLVADASPAVPAAGDEAAQPAGSGGPEGSQPPTPTSSTPEASRRRGGVSCEQPHRVVRVSREAPIHATPGGRRIGALPARSIYLDQPSYAWVQDVTDDGRWGRVAVPWTKPVGRVGWVRMEALSQSQTPTMVVADLSDRRITVYRRCRPVLEVRSAIGRPGSPSPTGRFWVTDRVVVPAAQRASFGSFAFGMSTVQPRLPQGWTGGDQMAIHGTGAPGSIGEAASAGCLRVSEDALRRLKPLLTLGTPVVIQS